MLLAVADTIMIRHLALCAHAHVLHQISSITVAGTSAPPGSGCRGRRQPLSATFQLCLGLSLPSRVPQLHRNPVPCRIKEYRAMVQALHALGLSVVFDTVYNHTFHSGTDGELG